MLKKVYIIAIIFFHAMSNYSWAQKTVNYSFRHINQTNGFPADYVYSMEFDATGQLWAITDQGLMRFNGHSGRFYTAKADSSQLLPSQPFNLYFDTQGKFWISYIDSYITCFNPVDKSFRHFIHDPNDESSFPNAMVSNFFEDSKGNFWIGTWGGGMCKMDRATGKFKRYLPKKDDPTSIQSTNITNFTEDKNGQLIVSTWEGDGYDNFIFYFDTQKEKFSRFDFTVFQMENIYEEEKVPAAFKIVHFIEIDEKENWWVGTYTGLFYVDFFNQTITRKTGLDKELVNTPGQITFDNTRFSLKEDDQKIWFATEVGGILVYDKLTDEVKYIQKQLDNISSLSGNIIRDFEKDRYGNIWVATNSGGLDIYSPNEQQVRIISNEYLQAQRMHIAQGRYAINSIVVSNIESKIIIAHGNGVSVYNTQTGEVNRIEIRKPFYEALKKNPELQEFNHNNPNFVGVLHELKDIYVFGTYCGEVWYHVKTGKLDFSRMKLVGGFYPSEYNGEENILTLAGERDVNFDQGVQIQPYIAELNTTTLNQKKIKNLPVDIGTGELKDYRAFEKIDANHYFLYFSNNSFMVFDSRDTSIEIFSNLSPHKNAPDSNYFLLHIDIYGIVWLRSENGLYGFDYKSKEFTDIKPELKLKNDDQIRCLTRDKQGILWIALQNDLLRYNVNTKEVFRFTNEHGFDAGGFTNRFIRRHNKEEVIIPANYGLLMFDPQRIVFHTQPPTVFMSEMIIGKDTLDRLESEQALQSKQEYKYYQNTVTIEFATDLLYASGGKMYEYRLVGWDEEWVRSATLNRVTYNNLEPGDYKFEVRCIDGYENISNTIVFEFFIDKPLWLKWWFILLEILLALAIIYIYIIWRERSLKVAKAKLEHAVDLRTFEVVEKAHEIERQKEIIEIKNKELTDSINYAKYIQDSLLAHREFLHKHIPDHSIFFRPKDIVSGDFYWAARREDAFYLAVCDSTGHGVPGAFMSLLNIRYLSEAIVEKRIDSPNLALDYVRHRLTENLTIDGTKDGMDGTLIKIEKEKKKLTYSSAQNHPVLIRDNKAIYLPCDKMPIGGGYVDDPFQPHQIDLAEGDVIYFFTDGYPDQFGGPDGKKFKHKNMVDLLLKIHKEPFDKQNILLNDHFEQWKGNLEQLDDILVMGIGV